MENPARNEGHATQQGKKKQSEDLSKTVLTITLIASYLYEPQHFSFTPGFSPVIGSSDITREP
jgi:hypothetical protein